MSRNVSQLLPGVTRHRAVDREAILVRLLSGRRTPLYHPQAGSYCQAGEQQPGGWRRGRIPVADPHVEPANRRRGRRRLIEERQVLQSAGAAGRALRCTQPTTASICRDS